jgi:uncharacterized protein (TIGR00730 family)
MKRICVFAGSSMGRSPKYKEGAVQLGQALLEAGLEMVYGGSSNGLMGVVADTVLQGNGTVIGVMPSGLFCKESAHQGVTQFYQVEGMHERKAKMYELSDGFVALPGGYGTFEEIFEAVCWGYIGIHQHPVGLLNIDGYYQPLIELVQHAKTEGYIPEIYADLLILDEDPYRLIERMIQYKPPSAPIKWRK